VKCTFELSDLEKKREREKFETADLKLPLTTAAFKPDRFGFQTNTLFLLMGVGRTSASLNFFLILHVINKLF